MFEHVPDPILDVGMQVFLSKFPHALHGRVITCVEQPQRLNAPVEGVPIALCVRLTERQANECANG